VREALHILAARPSSHEHGHHEHERAPPDADASSLVACHDQGAPTKDAVNWGQRISLGSNDDEDDTGETAAASLEDQKEKLEQERAKRRAVIEEKLASLSVEELLQCIMNSQEQRVVTYRAFDSYVLLVYCHIACCSSMHLRLLWMLLPASHIAHHNFSPFPFAEA